MDRSIHLIDLPWFKLQEQSRPCFMHEVVSTYRVGVPVAGTFDLGLESSRYIKHSWYSSRVWTPDYLGMYGETDTERETVDKQT